MKTILPNSLVKFWQLLVTFSIYLISVWIIHDLTNFRELERRQENVHIAWRPNYSTSITRTYFKH